MLLLLWIGCSGDKEAEEEETPADRLQQACVDQCDASAAGEGCDEAAVKRECEEVCGFVVLFLSEDCYDDYEAVLTCQTGLDYACGNGVEINGVDWPLPLDATACGEEELAYSDCLGTTL